MKKQLAALVGLVVLAGAPMIAADHEGHKGGKEFCTLHCKTTDLKKEVQALEKEITKDKTAMKAPQSGKMIEVQARIQKTRENLAMHEKLVAEAKAELDRVEAELNKQQ